MQSATWNIKLHYIKLNDSKAFEKIVGRGKMVSFASCSLPSLPKEKKSKKSLRVNLRWLLIINGLTLWIPTKFCLYLTECAPRPIGTCNCTKGVKRDIWIDNEYVKYFLIHKRRRFAHLCRSLYLNIPTWNLKPCLKAKIFNDNHSWKNRFTASGWPVDLVFYVG